MAKGYWIPHLDVSNPEGFQAYRTWRTPGTRPTARKLLARGGRREVVEGKMRARNVLREFNSYDVALAAYHGPEYSRAHPLREPHSVCDFLIVEGYDGPQPAPVGTPPAAAARKGYWIAHVDVTDPEGYKPVSGQQAPFGNSARFLVRGGVRGDGGQARAHRGAGIPSYERRSPATVRPIPGGSAAQGKAEVDWSSSKLSIRRNIEMEKPWPRVIGSRTSM